MRTMWNKFKNSEFLSFGELLRFKVTLVLFFVLVFSLLTIPVSLFEAFSLEITIVVPAVFVALFILSFILLALNKVRLAMHFSIYIFIGLTIYYVSGANQIYGYLFLFITLIVIIFYQDIYTYIIYGGAIVVYGVYFIAVRGNQLLVGDHGSLLLSNLIFQIVLVGFYLVYLINLILTDSNHEVIKLHQMKTKRFLDQYRSQSLKYLDEIREKKGIKPIYENSKFQQTVSEISIFINDFLEEKGENILEVVEFYFALHGFDSEEILSNSHVNVITQSYTKEFHKYLLNKNSSTNEMLFNIYSNFYNKHSVSLSRYDFNIDKFLTNKTNQLIALAILYVYLRKERTQFDKWGRIERTLSHEEICKIIQSKSFREYISYEEMIFFLQHQDLFDEYLR